MAFNLHLSSVFSVAASISLLIPIVAAQACAGNNATSRSSWCNYDINTDYYTTIPNTGRTVEYWLNVVNTTLSPDGYPRVVQTINGTIPGPQIEANWGDTVVVHLTNSMQNNGTALHFHGIRQTGTNPSDGTSSITQCPTAPGDTVTYKWRATEYGTSWYHSHFGFQAWNGMLGGIKINGPASANYQSDLDTLFLMDWDHITSDAGYHSELVQGQPSVLTGLINGQNVWKGAGKRFQYNWQAGQSYRLRLINSAMNTHYNFQIDNHTMQIIANDLVPVKPYYTNVLSIGIGQRYDVIIKADQAAVANNFWMRAIPDTACSQMINQNDIKGIVSYNSATSTPTTSPWNNANTTTQCLGEPAPSLSPVVSKTVGAAAAVKTGLIELKGGSEKNTTFIWNVNGISFNSSWADPTAKQALRGDFKFSSQQLVYDAPTKNGWYYMIIQNHDPTPAHPIHLHGHDAYILGMGMGNYSSAATLNLNNPQRRDTWMLPQLGWVAVAFQADNPGAWLVHCHIGWHSIGGFAAQVIDQKDKIAALYENATLNAGCQNWNKWVSNQIITQEGDDGI